MKKLIFTLLISASTLVYSQIMVVNEIETDSKDNFTMMVTHWMNAVKTAMDVKDLRSYVFEEPGTNKVQFLQFHDSKTDMVD